MSNKILTIAILLVSVLALFFWLCQPQSKKTRLRIGQTNFLVEIAKTAPQKAQGLGGRDLLGKKEGMLFIHTIAARHTYWMKGMRFGLDFVFIRDGLVVETIENIPAPKPGQTLQYVIAKKPFTSVVELNGGTVAEFKIKAGDKVSFPY